MLLRQLVATASLALLLVLSGGSLALAQDDVPGTEARLVGGGKDRHRRRATELIGSWGVASKPRFRQRGGKHRRPSSLSPSLPCPPISILLLTIQRNDNITQNKSKTKKSDCNVHPSDTEATAAARIARCSQLAPAALTAIDRASPVVEPPELMARRKANNAAAAAAAASAAAAGMGGGGANGDAVPGPAA